MRLAHILVCHTYPPAGLFDSIARDDSPWFVFLHGDSAVVRDTVHANMQGRRGIVLDYRVNRGLSKSWNEGIFRAMEGGAELMLILNDDLHFIPGMYDRFIRTCEENLAERDNISWQSPLGYEGAFSGSHGVVISQDFACAALHRSVFERVGYFDENFCPAYCEDADFARRCHYSGLRPIPIGPPGVEHGRGSTWRHMTPAARTAFDVVKKKNENYLRRKWGENLEFSRPFDRDIPLVIPYEERADPYGDGYRLE